MLTSKSSDVTKESTVQFWQDDKFCSRLLSKETSMGNPSFRVYYGGASGAVPFTWESQPGTPKHPISTTILPPLTPPPSYFFKSTTRSKAPGKKHRNLIHTILPKLALIKKPHSPPESSSPSSSSSLWSSSSSSPMTSPTGTRRRSRSSTLGSLISSGSSESNEDQDYGEEDEVPPASTPCFGVRHGGGGVGGGGGIRGGYCSVMVMKNALKAIVGHGSGQGTAA